MTAVKVNTLVALICCAAASGVAHGSTLDDVTQRGLVRCGVSTGIPGFSIRDDAGRWSGLDVDLCRAVAAAVLGDADKVKYVTLGAPQRLAALQKGQVDILAHNTTWTMARDVSMGLDFAGINYYDGQGFLLRKDKGVRSALELDGAVVCVQSETTSELNLKDYFAVNMMKYRPVTGNTYDESRKAYENGECDVLTGDQSYLYGLRTQLDHPDAYVVLPEPISKEPLGPVVREGDDRWHDIVQWTLFAMIDAEEKGVTSQNVDRVRSSSKNPTVRRLLGLEGNLGEALGLTSDWSYNIIKQVGNYGESFERNVGQGSPLKMQRGLNALWKDGGLLYAPPEL